MERGRGAPRRRLAQAEVTLTRRWLGFESPPRASIIAIVPPTMTRLLQPVERMLDALTDPARRERAVVWLLIAYCAAWSLYGALAKGSQDVHFDMGEMVAWSRDAGIGTPKHPPLGAWLVRRVVHGLSAQPTGPTTCSPWCSRPSRCGSRGACRKRYLDGEKRVAGLLLLTFIPFFNFHALKYNANTVLIPLWALVTWFFLRSYRDAQRDLGGARRRSRPPPP